MSEATEGALHTTRFPGESADYRQARDRLLEAEMALRRQVEAVAAQRRALPPGGPVPEDYVFEGQSGPVKLSALFGRRDTLLLYGFMLGPEMERACPSCTSIIDALDGEMRHVRQRVAFAAVCRSPLARFEAHARHRGWRDTQLLSAAKNSFPRAYHTEDGAGRQRPILNVFHRAGGEIRHTWASELAFAPADPGQNPRHVDLIWPLWGLLDLSPEGRGEFHPKLAYA